MSYCCMRRPAKFHVDSAVRFWAIANIREGGVKRPPPGQARVNCAGMVSSCVLISFVYDEFVPRFQKDPRSWVRWVQGLGPWWILDLARPFCRGTLETQDLKILICRKTLETQDLKISICSETLKTHDLKILIVARPWKPRTSKFGYVAKPWKPRVQNLKMLMSRDFKVLGRYNSMHSMQNFMLSIVPGSSTGDKLGRSDSKTWIVEK